MVRGPIKTTFGRWLLCLGLAVIFLALDYATGPLILFPITFVVPIGLAAWYLGRSAGLGFGVGMPVSRYLMELAWAHPAFGVVDGAINTLLRLVVLAGLGWVLARLAAHERKLTRRVQVLEGLLPICSFCKKIRGSGGTWEQVESYISARSGAQFSHGFCEPCAQQHYPEVFTAGATKGAEPGAAPGTAR